MEASEWNLKTPWKMLWSSSIFTLFTKKPGWLSGLRRLVLHCSGLKSPEVAPLSKKHLQKAQSRRVEHRECIFFPLPQGLFVAVTVKMSKK